MNSGRHLILSLILALICFMAGSFGYMLIEDWGFLDSAYMTIITLSTVGYKEVHAMSEAGRLFTVGLVVTGVGFTLYIAGAMVQLMVEGRIRNMLGRRRLTRKIKRLKNHYIVCGYGRIGRVLCRDLLDTSLDIVVIEQNEDLIGVMEKDGVPYISGDATDETVLTQAGITRAKGLVAVLATDADNVFLVLTARQLSDDLFIVARASDQRAKGKLRAAGADRVESPYDIGAASMAQRLLRPTVTTFLDLALARQHQDIQMEELVVSPHSKLVNLMLKDSGIRQQFNLILVAFRKPNGSMLFNPSFESVITGGDTVIAVGEAKNLKKLGKILDPDVEAGRQAPAESERALDCKPTQAP